MFQFHLYLFDRFCVWGFEFSYFWDFKCIFEILRFNLDRKWYRLVSNSKFVIFWSLNLEKSLIDKQMIIFCDLEFSFVSESSNDILLFLVYLIACMRSFQCGSETRVNSC